MKYLEQYERIKRWYQKFNDIKTGMSHNKDSNFYLDDIYAFFINCYHLKDWIKNDNTITINVSDIENFINNSTALSICADICNGLKHLTLDRPRVDSNTKLGRKKVKLTVGTAPTTIAMDIQVIVGKKKYDAFALATDYIKDWNNYLTSKSLL